MCKWKSYGHLMSKLWNFSSIHIDNFMLEDLNSGTIFYICFVSSVVFASCFLLAH